MTVSVGMQGIEKYRWFKGTPFWQPLMVTPREAMTQFAEAGLGQPRKLRPSSVLSRGFCCVVLVVPEPLFVLNRFFWNLVKFCPKFFKIVTGQKKRLIYLSGDECLSGRQWTSWSIPPTAPLLKQTQWPVKTISFWCRVNRVTCQINGWREFLMKHTTPGIGSHQKKFD